jgi:acetolactate synthase-1/2/3 large subunit
MALFRETVRRLNIPVLLTWLGIDLLPDDDPCFVGRPGAVAPRGPNFALQNADLLLVLGARLDLVLTGYAPERLARAARKIMVDIDEAEIRKVRPAIDIPAVADAGAFLRELSRQAEDLRPQDRTAWWRRCKDWKARYPVVLPEHHSGSGPVSVYALADVLSDELGPTDLVVSGSSGAGIETFLLALRVKDGQRVLHTTALGAMGFGLPAAIGGCLASGRKRTIVVDGDGGFQFNIQELETVARLRLPIVFFILNNGGYSSIRTSQQTHFGRVMSADAASGLTLPDLQKVVRAYGLDVATIEDRTDLRSQVRRVLAHGGPIVCVVRVIPDEDRLPRIASRQRSDGSMVSTPLEDLFPFLSREEFHANMIVPPLPESEVV